MKILVKTGIDLKILCKVLFGRLAKKNLGADKKNSEARVSQSALTQSALLTVILRTGNHAYDILDLISQFLE